MWLWKPDLIRKGVDIRGGPPQDTVVRSDCSLRHDFTCNGEKKREIALAEVFTSRLVRWKGTVTGLSKMYEG